MHSSLYRLALMNSCTHKSKGSPLKIAFYPYSFQDLCFLPIFILLGEQSCDLPHFSLPFILGCSDAYNLSRYPQWDRLNSQTAEQANSCLRYIKASLSYMNQKNSCTIASFSYGIEISCTVNSFPHELCYNTLYPSQSWVANHIPLRF